MVKNPKIIQLHLNFIFKCIRTTFLCLTLFLRIAYASAIKVPVRERKNMFSLNIYVSHRLPTK